MSTKIYILENLGCAHCAAKMEEKISEISGISEVSITYTTKQLRVTAQEPDLYLEEIRKICSSIESQVKVVPRELKVKKAGEESQEIQNKKVLGDLPFIITGALLFVCGMIAEHLGRGELGIAVFVAAYLVLGGKILLEAARNISKGQIFDEIGRASCRERV